MRKIYSIITLLLLLIVSTATLSQNEFMSQIIYQELDGANAGSNTVVIGGKVYKYELNIKNSSYRFPADADTSLSLNEVRQGEAYYFEIVSRDKDMKNNKFTEVIFISKQKPSE